MIHYVSIATVPSRYLKNVLHHAINLFLTNLPVILSYMVQMQLELIPLVVIYLDFLACLTA